MLSSNCKYWFDGLAKTENCDNIYNLSCYKSKKLKLQKKDKELQNKSKKIKVIKLKIQTTTKLKNSILTQKKSQRAQSLKVL